MSELPCPEQPENHQDERAGAVEPARPAEEQPPEENNAGGSERPHHPKPEPLESRDDDFQAEPREQQQDDSDRAGPQPERLRAYRYDVLSRAHSQTIRHTGVYCSLNILDSDQRVACALLAAPGESTCAGSFPPAAALTQKNADRASVTDGLAKQATGMCPVLRSGGASADVGRLQGCKP